MGKLSEAGKLYLKDYLILNEARKDMEYFLNSVVEEIYTLILEEKDDLCSSDFKVNLWENKSSKGHLNVSFSCLVDKKLFRKNKSDIEVIYRDIRNTTKLTNSTSAIVYVWSPVIASTLKNEFKNLSKQQLGEDLYDAKIVEFDLSNSSQTAEKVTEAILDKCNSINKIISILD